MASTPSTDTPAADSAAIQGEENKFQKAISAWRNIDLNGLMPSLDSAASDLVAHQRDSLVQRKDLAQKTKDFRKLDDAGKLTEIKSILKSYQTYIDIITNQSKATHSAFLQIYTPLSEAPDPYPLLEASIDSLVTAEETLPKVQDENEQLRKQVGKLSGNLEETEKRLEQERAARQALEESKEDKIKAVETSWNAVMSEKRDNWEAKEKGLEEKLEHQERLIKEIKASYEVNQRLNQGEEANAESNRAGATAAELEIVHSELDRTSMRLAEVEARNEQLRLELAQASSAESRSSAIEDDPAFLRLQSENSSLMRRFETVRLDKDTDKRKWAEQTKSLEREVGTLKKDRDLMRQKLQHWSDYDNVKQELEVLKSIEFATGDDDQDFDTTVGAEAITTDFSISSGKKETLEQLLLSRNKKLSSELTLLRVSHQDLQSRLETLQEEMSANNMELEKSRNLCATLESDLEKVQQEADNNFPSSAMSVAGTYTSRYPHSSYKGARGARGQRSTSPTSSIISGFDPTASPGGTLDALRHGESGASSNSILPMITAQRDRFKKKNTDLEAELQKSYQSIQSLRSEVAALQKDNLTLYEKTRYVSSYNRTASAAAPVASQPTTIQIDEPDSRGEQPAFTRYRSAYEANISPFSAFRSRESARAFKRMNVPERAVFQITRMVLATRTSRNLFALYCAGLHVLVLIMLFSMGEGGSRRFATVKSAPVVGPLAAGDAGPAAKVGANI
ncbi:hypothetical protein BT63DRAFT_396306 [Microthyrium microscopicum]|uniref:Protein CASP n=1 Tax=Microthyrium microscopicum TaxID=703497 RepID=A0A6A6UNE9_9PEZI|nr:hypothetical protein BT63DRAFT_396306 [Microthyrium microscopicum]